MILSQTLTSEYEFAHGKKPKGEGNWMLKVVHIDENGNMEKTMLMKYGMLSQLIKEIYTQYPNVYRIKVMP